ncbi:hypothetical protein TREMEDRAFT_61579 [Tremella mesenterica DSM 1558]|uniref:uncharacterized protein n=1 Tax=Tremella mesenterica (strain ATCC 24925 / CBS 8224 / DSM 1558 / NBRC 9311 / NRRL Y-6157 / RJB 2259-6 / UBC 559-6) TaxID=578456 RepID=UPI0003F49145|nr:uncharacterized protein TREMEDRAFT_61579 [Tremella mesenterica DSM 1558]EIW69810.1 hypothetical protein TREMEDRAFT_61579 [Tremella mesenterica DSM 1558]
MSSTIVPPSNHSSRAISANVESQCVLQSVSRSGDHVTLLPQASPNFKQAYLDTIGQNASFGANSWAGPSFLLDLSSYQSRKSKSSRPTSQQQIGQKPVKNIVGPTPAWDDSIWKTLFGWTADFTVDEPNDVGDKEIRGDIGDPKTIQEKSQWDVFTTDSKDVRTE